ncbi:MAG: carboxypeptidase-like regulatory domain-containing protein [Caldimonas sp.]
MKLRALRRTHPPCSAARSLLAALCAALALAVSASPASAQSLSLLVAAIQRGAEANLLVLEVRLDGHLLSDSFTAYQDGGQVLLPLGELSRLLTLAIAVQPARGTASGFVIREDRTFELSVDDSLASIRGRQKSFEPRMATVVGDDIYVSSKLLSHWLPIDLEVHLGKLQLLVRPRERLPLQERLEREGQGGRLRAGETERNDLGYPRVTSPYGSASLPFIDQTFSSQALLGSGSRDFQAAYTLYATGDLLGMEAAAYVSTHRQSSVLSRDGGSGGEIRVTLARHDPDEGLLGPLHARSFVAGGIVVPSVPNVMIGSPTGNGVMVSNRPLDQPTSFDRHTFRGNLPPGWDVTLYYNDALVGYQTERADGQYSFDDLPLSFGPNEFRLVFNGPLGQIRVERRSFLLDRSMLAPGQLLYSLAQHRADNGGLRSVVQADFGLTRSIAANAAVVRKPRLGGVDEADRTYGQFGLRGYFDSMIVSSQVTHEQGRGALFELAAKTRVGGYSLDFFHLQRTGRFESDLLSDSAEGLRYRDGIRVNGSMRLANLPPMTVAVDAVRDSLVSGADRIGLAGRVSTIVKGTAITNSVDWMRADGVSTSQGVLQLSRRVVDVGVSAQAGYTVRPRLALETLALTADRALGAAYRVVGGVQRTMSSPLTVFSAGLTKNLGSFGLGLNASYSSKRELTLGLQLFVAIGREPRSGAWMVDAQPLAGTGAISARAFVDRNQNGVRDAGEELVPEAGFIINGGGRHPSRTDGSGTAFIGRLVPGQYADIALDPTTLEDPQWKPLTPGLRVLPRPGVVEVLEFPVVATSEIDGTVFLVRKGDRRGIGSARVELVDERGNVVASTQSSGDGYYLLHQVLPGRYSLRIAPEQAEKLGLQGALVRALTVPIEGDFINGQDFELSAAPR